MTVTPEQALADAKLYLLTQEGKAFYAFALACMREYPRSKLVPVAGIVPQGPQLTLHTNPDIFPDLPLVVRARVLEHEVLHLLHRHVPVRRSLDPILWNTSCDCAVNALMKPKHPHYVDPNHPEKSLIVLLPERMPIPLPASADAETYYMLLQKDAAACGGKKLVVIVRGDGKAWAITREGDRRIGNGWKVYDLHPHFQTGQDPQDTKGERPAPLVSEEVIEAEIRRIVQEACKMAGSVPGNLQTVIDKLFTSTQDWRRVLSSFATSVYAESRRRSFARPSRRYSGYPGRRRELAAHIACVIDTSGSMSEEELTAIGSELYSIARTGNCLVEVAEADAVVQHTYTLTEPMLKARMRSGMAGRGGTVFRPAFEWAMKQQVDGLIYFTDGYNADGHWLEHFRPPFPVLWVITAQGQFPASWGWRLRLGARRQVV